MDFRLTEEQEGVRRLAHDLVEKEVKPRAAHVDETGEFPWETLRQMGELGLLGLNIPEAYGGAGADHVSAAILIEEIGRGCGSTGLIVAAHLGLACGPLNAFGTESQKQAFLVPLARGQAIGCLALTEPGAGSDLAGGVRTFAERRGDSWSISGQKMWLTNGAEARTAILLCRTDKRGGSRSLSQIHRAYRHPGISFGKPEPKMGLNGSHTYAVSLDDVVVPAENLLGQEGHGLHQTLQVLDGGRISIGALSVGLAQPRTRHPWPMPTRARLLGRLWPDTRPSSTRSPIWLLPSPRPLAGLPGGLAARPGPAYTLEAAQAKLFATEMGGKSLLRCHPDPRWLRL